ncbi:multicopper oxidase family protein [Micromonospora yasonensis]|uniref:multicopper oxidase family protein n=1 Tax=Micromonospora yasonensis TaxID=1128667 RepID=UPI00222FAE6D|nr:multicopper oxidase family protein [Micromonospora yasonensis]MCW3842492.1 multicopper oxidase family protein [Micromonospora yasonensis]
MFEALLNFSEIIPLLTMIFGGLAGYRAGQLVRRRHQAALRRSVLTTLVLLVVATIGVLALPALSAPLVQFGWDFASNRFLVGLPPMAIAAVATWVLSVPRLARLRREAARDKTTALTAEQRYAAADPRLVVPVQLLGISGFLGVYVLMVYRPVTPYTIDIITVNGILLAVAALFWLRHTRRQRILGGEEPRRGPGFLLRVGRGLAGVAAVVLAVGAVIVAGQELSKLPPNYDMSMSHNMDWGGGPRSEQHEAMGMRMTGHHSGLSVSELNGGADTQGTPDKTFTLTAMKKTITVAGKQIEAWGYNGQIPGPEIRVNDGDLVQVTLINQIPDIGVTIHWHGLDVPNSQDGVPGVTQDAVRTGQQFVYRFRVHQTGTYWYHSHQSAFAQVDRGLFGPLVVLPKGAKSDPYDMTVTTHDWKLLKENELARDVSYMTFDQTDGVEKRAVPAGSPVRLRIVNSGTSAVNDEKSPTYVLTGTPFKVAATEGTEVDQPSEIKAGTGIVIGTGGRADLTFTMPNGPVRLTNIENPSTGLVLSPDGTADAPAPAFAADGPLFKRDDYGAPASTPFGLSSHFDRTFKLVLDDGPGFFNGKFDVMVKINGEVFPNTPMLMVRQGDLVKVTIVGRGHVNHPMHLHGHQALVLSHNGKPITGSPWWTDTLEVQKGDIYEIAFKANNPGIWMDHCHNLQHTEKGMVMHLGYEGVTTPYRAGTETGNLPEGQ